MTEAELQACVIDLARVMHWRCAHFRPAKTEKGWRTPVGADGKGWPDLFMCRGWQNLAVELKSAKGKMTPEQTEWKTALLSSGIPFATWTPANWENGDILKTLKASSGEPQ